MFRIVSEPIQGPLTADHRSVGGWVVFEGRVRDINEGQAVLALEYEAFDELAVREGEAILAEARARFDVLDVACVHRVGRLELMDVAIRVEAAAVHRREAFEACEFIVDEVKRRVPIWKKEHYLDGESEWVDASGGRVVTPKTLYGRQIRLSEVGEAGQAKLTEASVLVVGAGGLAASALPYLAAAGIGRIGIVDDDRVDVSNLHRQPLFRAADVGKPKASRAAARLRDINPLIQVEVVEERVVAANADSITDRFDIVLDCTDNFATKFLLNDRCLANNKILVTGSLDRFDGQVMLVRPGGPCLRCLHPQEPVDGCVGTCEEDGVLGFVPGAIGTLMAAEAVKSLLGLETLGASIVWIDLLDLSITKIKLTQVAGCPGCGESSERRATIWVDELLPNDVAVDIRSEVEHQSDPVRCDLHWPNGRIDLADHRFTSGARIVLVCSKGVRSASLAQELRSQGFLSVYSYSGGARRLARRSGD